MKTLFITLRSAIFGTGFIFLWGWVALSLRRYDFTLGIALSDWTPALGMALMVVGGTLAFACVATFVTRREGTPAPFDPPRKFVVAGPYRFVRNPMYIGGFVVLLGFTLYDAYCRSIMVVDFISGERWRCGSHLPAKCSIFGRPDETHSTKKRMV